MWKFFVIDLEKKETYLGLKAASWWWLRWPILEICSVDIISVSVSLGPEKVTMKRIWMNGVTQMYQVLHNEWMHIQNNKTIYNDTKFEFISCCEIFWPSIQLKPHQATPLQREVTKHQAPVFCLRHFGWFNTNIDSVIKPVNCHWLQLEIGWICVTVDFADKSFFKLWYAQAFIFGVVADICHLKALVQSNKQKSIIKMEVKAFNI